MANIDEELNSPDSRALMEEEHARQSAFYEALNRELRERDEMLRRFYEQWQRESACYGYGYGCGYGHGSFNGRC